MMAGLRPAVALPARACLCLACCHRSLAAPALRAALAPAAAGCCCRNAPPCCLPAPSSLLPPQLGYSTMSGATSSSAFDLTTACADEEELPHRPDFFHAMFGLASCYMAMIYVGWDLTGDDTADFQIDRGWGSTWVKMAASWLAGECHRDMQHAVPSGMRSAPPYAPVHPHLVNVQGSCTRGA